MQTIVLVGLLFLNLVPILLQETPLSPLLQQISKSQMSMTISFSSSIKTITPVIKDSDVNEVHNVSFDPWLFTSPVVIFVVNCVFDLGLALMFTFIDVNDATTICINNDCNATMNRIVPWLILSFTLGISSWEMRALIGMLLATSRTKDSDFWYIL